MADAEDDGEEPSMTHGEPRYRDKSEVKKNKLTTKPCHRIYLTQSQTFLTTLGNSSTISDRSSRNTSCIHSWSFPKGLSAVIDIMASHVIRLR